MIRQGNAHILTAGEIAGKITGSENSFQHNAAYSENSSL
jgi:hypothetical protein